MAGIFNNSSNKMPSSKSVFHDKLKFFADSADPDRVEIWDIETSESWQGTVIIFHEIDGNASKETQAGGYYITLNDIQEFLAGIPSRQFEAHSWAEVEDICIRELFF